MSSVPERPDPLAELHARLAPSIRRIVDAVHSTDLIQPGEEWTIPVDLDCGFEGEIVLRVSDAGACKRRTEAES